MALRLKLVRVKSCIPNLKGCTNDQTCKNYPNIFLFVQYTYISHNWTTSENKGTDL